MTHITVAPDVVERMKAGEFRTVAVVERAAGVKGIADRRVWLSADPEEAADKLMAAFLVEYVRALVQVLQERL